MDQDPRRDAALVNFRWLVSLRWLLVSCAAGLFAAVQIGIGGMPMGQLAALTLVAAASNAVLPRVGTWRGPPSAAFVAGVVLLDVAWLTLVLASTGGAHNPFAVLYLFEVMVAALVLPPVWVAVVCTLGGLAYAELFQHMPPEHDMHQMTNHLRGMWVAYGVAAPFVAYAVHHLRRALGEADASVRAAQDRAAKTERLASLATLAAGAAHEIANPLATIAIVAAELARRGPAPVTEDAQLVQREVERCREVLHQLSAQVGAGSGETLKETTVRALLDEVVTRPEAKVDVLDLPDDLAGLPIRVPPRLLAQALRRLVVNAREASPAGSPVSVKVDRDADTVRIRVEDVGSGMEADHLARAGEPFFTTKSRGMGLGLYFARSVVEQCGGRLQLDSAPARGTTATLALPVRPA
jgi:two-component system, sensor histidine kinase RegB